MGAGVSNEEVAGEVTVGSGAGVGADNGADCAAEVGCGFKTTTPLFHTNFFPDLTQVKVLFWLTTFWFKTLQAVKGVTFSAAAAVIGIRAKPKARRTPLVRLPLICIPQG